MTGRLPAWCLHGALPLGSAAPPLAAAAVVDPAALAASTLTAQHPLLRPLPTTTARDLGEYVDSFTAEVAVHDVAALRITPLQPPYDEGWRPWHGQPVYDSQAANLAVQRKQDWVGAAAPWRDIQAETAVPVYPAPPDVTKERRRQ